MKNEIEIPDGCEAKIVGNKVVLVPKESEDERIRKVLLKYFNERNSYRDEDETFNGVPFPSIIAYLERQKDEAQKQFNLGIQAGKEEAMYEMKPLSTEEIELNSIAFLEQLGYTCVPPGAEQKPAEWSEDEIGHLYTLARYIKSNGYEDDGEFLEGVANKLKSLRPQPHWKPSVEQMKYLDVAIAEANGHKSYNLADGLVKLKDDLEKL